jgi:hypothetical protein
MKIAAVLALAFWLSTCWTPLGGANDQETEHQNLQRLEAEARALANASGCTTAGSCQSAAVGAKACGGPRSYVVYCATTTDVPRLTQALEALRKAEEAYNQRHGIVSDCAMVLPPRVELSGGQCRAGADFVIGD